MESRTKNDYLQLTLGKQLDLWKSSLSASENISLGVASTLAEMYPYKNVSATILVTATPPGSGERQGYSGQRARAGCNSYGVHNRNLYGNGSSRILNLHSKVDIVNAKPIYHPESRWI